MENEPELFGQPSINAILVWHLSDMIALVTYRSKTRYINYY